MKTARDEMLEVIESYEPMPPFDKMALSIATIFATSPPPDIERLETVGSLIYHYGHAEEEREYWEGRCPDLAYAQGAVARGALQHVVEWHRQDEEQRISQQ